MYPIVRRNTVPATRSLFDGFFDDDRGLAPFFNTFFNDSTFNNVRAVPDVRTNVTNNENDYRIDVIVPGLDKSDIVVDVDDTTLTISYEARETDNNVVSYRSFNRSWTLPQNTKFNDVSAEYNQGILSITVPKSEVEIPTTHRIEVK